ncbi:hypothetical protein QAD02_013566 [Eretmocerus hayati]|uniref:Uncharacterized protein n=1 Tax=Eretmocerus hayati TaxID=131215 RepID=A0ACC2P5G2_9HYME|nr:hypothetical protein QAD02_013566 [Eretmocerus hayati]
MEGLGDKDKVDNEWVALVNYLNKNFGDKSLQIVSCADIKHFNRQKFIEDMSYLERMKLEGKKVDPEEVDKMKFYNVAWFNEHKEKVFKAAEVIAVRAMDVINARDGEIETNVPVSEDQNNDATSAEDAEHPKNESSSDEHVGKRLKRFKIDAQPSESSSSDEMLANPLGEVKTKNPQKGTKRRKKKAPKKDLKFKKSKGRRRIRSLSSSSDDSNAKKKLEPISRMGKGKTVRVVTSDDERVLTKCVQEMPKLDFGSTISSQSEAGEVTEAAVALNCHDGQPTQKDLGSVPNPLQATDEAITSSKEMDLKKTIEYLMRRDDEREKKFEEFMRKQVEKNASMVSNNQANRAALNDELESIKSRELTKAYPEPLAKKKLSYEGEDPSEPKSEQPSSVLDTESIIDPALEEDGEYEAVPTTSARPASEGLKRVDKKKDEKGEKPKSKKRPSYKKKKHRKSKKSKKEKKAKRRRFGEYTDKELKEFKQAEEGKQPMTSYTETIPETNSVVPTFHMHNGVTMHQVTWDNIQELIGTAFFRAMINVVWPTREMGNRALDVSRARQIYGRSPRKEFTPRKVACVKDVFVEHVDKLAMKEKKKRKLKKSWSSVLSSAMSVAHKKLYDEGEGEEIFFMDVPRLFFIRSVVFAVKWLSIGV